MVGVAGDITAAICALNEQDKLRERFSNEYIARINSVISEAKIAEKVPANAWALSQGLYAALWKLGEENNCGVEIDALEIPIKQEIIEVCELAGVNPYEGISSGYIYLSDAPNAGVVIGETTKTNDRVIRLRDHNRFLYKPR